MESLKLKQHADIRFLFTEGCSATVTNHLSVAVYSESFTVNLHLMALSKFSWGHQLPEYFSRFIGLLHSLLPVRMSVSKEEEGTPDLLP